MIDNPNLNNEILELLKQGKKQKEIARILNISPSTVSKRIKVIMYAGQEIPNAKHSVSDEEILELRFKGLKMYQIAKALNISPSTVSLRLANMKERGLLVPSSDFIKDEKDEKIIEYKEQGLSQNEIAEKLNVSPAQISLRVKILRENGIEINTPKTQSELLDEKIISLREKRMTIEEISKALDLNISTVSHRIHRMKKRGINASKGSLENRIDEFDLEVEKLKNEGLSQSEIANKLGVSQTKICSTIRKLREMGIEFKEIENESRLIDKKIIELRKQKATIEDIANVLGISKMGVNKRIDKMRKKGIDVPEAAYHNEDHTELDNKIISLANQGMKYKDIARTLKLGKNAVSRRLLANGIRKRKPKKNNLKNKVSEEKVAKAILKLQESRNATPEQLEIIAKYYEVDLNIVTKLSKYIDER